MVAAGIFDSGPGAQRFIDREHHGMHSLRLVRTGDHERAAGIFNQVGRTLVDPALASTPRTPSCSSERRAWRQHPWP